MGVTDDFQATLWQEMMAIGLFEEAGEKTLRLWLEGGENARWRETYDFILSKMDEIVKRP